jgi:hypothetical protein
MLTVVKSLRGVIPSLFNSRSALHLEILVLRYQLNLVTRGSPRSADITEVPMAECLCPAVEGHPTRVCRPFGGLQRMDICGEVLATYARYYNGACTHRSLYQDTPFGRLVQRVGTITDVPHWADCTIRSSEFYFGKAQEELKWNPITILCWA